METKEVRIAELKRQILEIEKEVDLNFELIEVIPDCGGGIKDDETTIAISKDMLQLVAYSEDNFTYSPSFKRDKEDGKTPCQTWYKLGYTKTQIL